VAPCVLESDPDMTKGVEGSLGLVGVSKINVPENILMGTIFKVPQMWSL
jgi:hypothetical protein